MITLERIKKSFFSKVVLADLNLSVFPGELVCLCGPSGCGKTTILEIVAGTLTPDKGKRYCETNRIGYAMQDDCLIPWLTVKENLLYALLSYYPRYKAQEIADNWLLAFSLLDVANNKPSSLSGGMKRRINIARALSINPDLLLLDEPFAFQDEQNCMGIANAIKELQRETNCTIVISSHTPIIQWLSNSKVYQFEKTPLELSAR